MDGFRRKQCRSRLNFVAGRLIYLASPARLGDLAAASGEHAEYAAPAAVLRAVGTRDVTELLTFGVAALAVLHLEGLHVDHVQPPQRESLLRLADWREDSAGLLDSPDPFVREFACLHGLDDPDANRIADQERLLREQGLTPEPFKNALGPLVSVRAHHFFRGLTGASVLLETVDDAARVAELILDDKLSDDARPDADRAAR